MVSATPSSGKPLGPGGRGRLLGYLDLVRLAMYAVRSSTNSMPRSASAIVFRDAGLPYSPG